MWIHENTLEYIGGGPCQSCKRFTRRCTLSVQTKHPCANKDRQTVNNRITVWITSMDKKDNSSAVFQSSHREAQSQRSAKGRKEELQARYQERFKTRSATKHVLPNGWNEVRQCDRCIHHDTSIYLMFETMTWVSSHLILVSFICLWYCHNATI